MTIRVAILVKNLKNAQIAGSIGIKRVAISILAGPFSETETKEKRIFGIVLKAFRHDGLIVNTIT